MNGLLSGVRKWIVREIRLEFDLLLYMSELKPNDLFVFLAVLIRDKMSFLTSSAIFLVCLEIVSGVFIGFCDESSGKEL